MIIKIGKYNLSAPEKPMEYEIKVNWEWIVLDTYEDKVNNRIAALLLSRDVIDWEFYDGSNTLLEPARPAVWRTSYARQYLQEVYDYAFNDDEKRRILRNKIGDHLFLLTAEEILMKVPPKYRASEIRFIGMKPVKYCWWTNTIGAEANMMAVVDEHGNIDYVGYENDKDEIGMRPAMWIAV